MFLIKIKALAFFNFAFLYFRSISFEVQIFGRILLLWQVGKKVKDTSISQYTQLPKEMQFLVWASDIFENIRIGVY